MEHKIPNIWWLFFSNSYFKLHHGSCRNCRWCKVLLLLRNTVNIGSLVSSCSASSGCWEHKVRGHGLLTLCIIKGMRTCAHPGDQILRDTAEPEEPKTFMPLDLWVYKSPGLPMFEVPPQRYQLELLLFYMVIASSLNYFKDWDIWESAIGNLGSSQ